LIEKHRLSEILIRNRKKVVGGFMPRAAAIWPVELTPEERQAYDATSDYVRDGYARARETKNNALGFLMAVFQKLNTSSSFALRQSLLRRIEKLEGGLRPPASTPNVEDVDLEEKPIEDALSDLLGAAEERAIELTRAEIAELETIVRALDRIQLDSKARILIEKLAEIAEDDPEAKVIIFTQFRDTQEYLRGHIPPPWTAHLFHGQLKPTEKEGAVARFRDLDGPQLLISTEAGGEGRNFQFCHILINYDLPWNPMKVEQRIGRIDRIGQKHPVKIFNFSTLGTIEERVVEVLQHRIGVFQETIGGLDPILGEVEKDLRKIFRLADKEAERDLANLERQLESRMREARRTEERLADLIMDSRSFRKDEVEELLERHGSTDNQDLRRFVINALAELEVKINSDRDVEGTHFLILSDRFFAAFPQFTRDDIKPRVTFDPTVALAHEEIDFLAFGHQLVEALVDRVLQQEYGGRAGVRVVLNNEQDPREGWLFVYVLEFGGISPSKELLPVFIDLEGSPDPDLARWLLARSCVGKREEFGKSTPPLPSRGSEFEEVVESAEQAAVERLVARQGELLETNQQRLAQERAKLERFYEYRERAAAEKLSAVETVFNRLSQSPDPAVQRVVPVWAANVETARKNMAATAAESERRLSALTQLDNVAAQHQRIVAAYVEIRPDIKEMLSPDRSVPRDLLDRLRMLARPTTSAELQDHVRQLHSHSAKLAALGKKSAGKFDASLPNELAAQLISAADQDLDDGQRALLRGAMDYLMLVDDEEHDLKPGGFMDDEVITKAVLTALNGT
jgi:ATP-dependent helicase HepA